MELGLVLFTILSFSIGYTNGAAKISNGKFAVSGQFGYDVRLEINKFMQCGGTILNEKWILTAAHCFVPIIPAKIKVEIGYLNVKDKNASSEGYVLYKDLVIIHPFFNRGNFWNDIALVRVKGKIHLDRNNSRAITLPEPDRVDYNGSAIATGWGRQKENGNLSDHLMWAEIPFVTNMNCSKQYGLLFNPYLMVCAGGDGRDTCQGDSGGPLTLINYLIGKNAPVQVGIVSTGKACGGKDATIYTRLSTYVNWIRKWIGGGSNSSSTTTSDGVDSSSTTSSTTRRRGGGGIRLPFP